MHAKKLLLKKLSESFSYSLIGIIENEVKLKLRNSELIFGLL